MGYSDAESDVSSGSTLAPEPVEAVEADEEEEAERIRETLAEVPFGQLAQIQQKVGMRGFHSELRGRRANRGAFDRDQLRARLSEQAGGAETSVKELEEKKRRYKGNKPRLDKNACVVISKATGLTLANSSLHNGSPMEVTSKRPVTRFQQVVEVPKRQVRDPRFSSLSGEFNQDLFEKSYAFLGEVREAEMATLKKQIQTSKDDVERARLVKTMQSIDSKRAQHSQEKARQEIKRVWRKTEIEAIETGKKRRPFYLKDMDLKKLELATKYDGLKASDVDKAMEKKRKRNRGKEIKFLPTRRVAE